MIKNAPIEFTNAHPLSHEDPTRAAGVHVLMLSLKYVS